MNYKILAVSASVLGLAITTFGAPASALSLGGFTSFIDTKSILSTSTSSLLGNTRSVSLVLNPISSNLPTQLTKGLTSSLGGSLTSSLGGSLTSSLGGSFGSLLGGSASSGRMSPTPSSSSLLSSLGGYSFMPISGGNSDFDIRQISSSIGGSGSNYLTNLSGISGSGLFNGSQAGSQISTVLSGTGGANVLSGIGGSGTRNISSALKGLEASFANYNSFLDFKKKQATKPQSSGGGLGGLFGGSINIGGINISGSLGANGLTGSASLGGLNLASGGLGSNGLSGGFNSGSVTGITNNIRNTATSGLSNAANNAIRNENILRQTGMISPF